MRIYTKKLLTFLLVLALLLSSMNIILSVFAAETGVNLQLNGGTLQGSSEVYSAGDALPDSAMITRAGAAFGGWYTDAEFTGDRIFTVPSDAAAGTTYYARWIYYSFDFVNFDSYDTDSDMTAVWLNWGTDVADYSLNSDSSHAASGKSMKIDIKQANTNADIVTQTYNNTKSGDGIAFWVESANGITVKFRFNGKSQYISQIKTVPAGKHFVMIPWSELGESLTASYLWQAEFFIKVPNADETVYLDDIGTYVDYSTNITYNLNGGSWAEGYTPDEVYNKDEGLTLPVMSNVNKDGFAFAGWYDNEELAGNAVYSIPAGTLGNKKYWAKWICNSANFDSFESYNTNADMLNADHWDDFHWPAQNSVTSLNTDPAHANNSEKSLKVSPNAANTFAQLVVQRVNFPQNGDGIAFWIESDNGATVKVRLRNTTYESQERTVPGGKHIVTIPWSEMNGAYDADWLSPTKIFVSVPNGSDAVYIDDIGTYAVPNGITANWENGFTHSYDENGKTVWNYSKTADDSSYIGFATDYVLEKGKNYVIAFEYKYLKDGNLAWSLEPQAVGSAFDESEIMQQTDESKQTLNSKDRNSDWATKKIVFAADGENKYLGFFGKTEAGAEYDISIKNIRLYALGDVDFNGNIDTSDLASLKKSLLGAESIIEFADVNNDGKTDILDLISLKKMLAK